jgi:hypothetical protein
MIKNIFIRGRFVDGNDLLIKQPLTSKEFIQLLCGTNDFGIPPESVTIFATADNGQQIEMYFSYNDSQPIIEVK